MWLKSIWILRISQFNRQRVQIGSGIPEPQTPSLKIPWSLTWAKNFKVVPVVVTNKIVLHIILLCRTDVAVSCNVVVLHWLAYRIGAGQTGAEAFCNTNTRQRHWYVWQVHLMAHKPSWFTGLWCWKKIRIVKSITCHYVIVRIMKKLFFGYQRKVHFTKYD